MSLWHAEGQSYFYLLPHWAILPVGVCILCEVSAVFLWLGRFFGEESGRLSDLTISVLKFFLPSTPTHIASTPNL
jgi:hypothetical protein